MWGPNGHWEESELQWEAMMILKTGMMCSDLDTHTPSSVCNCYVEKRPLGTRAEAG